MKPLLTKLRASCAMPWHFCLWLRAVRAEERRLAALPPGEREDAEGEV